MQNVQNAAEIQQRVINLVELYRTKVAGVGSDKYKAVCEYEKAEEQKQIEAQQKNGASSFSISISIPDELANQIKVNEQLLGYFYKLFEGEKAEASVINHLLANYYDDTILSTSDESFLVSHFKEMVNYIISTPCSHLSMKDWDEKDIWYIPEEVLNLACNRIRIPDNAIVYNPFVGFAQFATKLKNCSFICEDAFPAFNERNKIEDRKSDIFAWTKLALVANKADTRNDEGTLPFDAVLSYIPYIPEVYSKEKDIALRVKFESYTASIFLNAYKRMKEGGQMGIIIPNVFLWKCDKQYPMKEFWEAVIHDNSLSEIIQLPSVMSYNCHHNYCLIVITRKPVSLTTMIDARFASRELTNDNVISMNDLINGKVEEFVEEGISMRAIAAGEEVVLMGKNGKSNFIKALDINKLNAAVENGGKEAETGLRKIIKIEPSTLNIDLLVPQVYVVETPLSNEAPVSLSTLSTMVNTHVRDIKYNLPNKTPWIREKNLSYTYQGELDLSHPDVDKAECPNIPPHTDDYVFDENGELDSELPWSQKTEIGNRVVGYRNCYYLDGKKDAVLFKFDTKGPKLAIVRATQKPLAVDNRIYVFVPNAGVDVFRLYVLLSMPLVYRQIQAIRDFGIYGNLHKVLIPMDQRIVGDEEKKALLEGETYKNHEEKIQSIKTEYINEVRMRKHDMGQYIFELVNIEDLMRYYLNNRDTEKDSFQQMESLLDNFRSSLGELSTLLDNLSKEEKFGNPESFNMTEFLSGLEKRHTKDSYRIQYTCDLPSIKRYNRKRQMKEQAELAAISDQMMEEDMKQQAELDAIADQMMEEDMKRLAELDAINDQMMMEDMKQRAELDAIADQMMEEDMKQQAELDAINDQMMEEDMKQQTELDAINDQMIIEDIKLQADTEVPLTMSSVIGRDNGISANANMYMPPIYVAPNDFQRLVNNILNNAKRHGFTNPNKKDYVVQINASIDAESGMYQIDFRNNGDPLPEGMNKTRYGLKGEKAGRTAGTGLGGNYVKSFVEHYGGDYDIFMEDGWTVVRICLPIK